MSGQRCRPPGSCHADNRGTLAEALGRAYQEATTPPACRKVKSNPAPIKTPEIEWGPWEAVNYESGWLCHLAKQVFDRNPAATVSDLRVEFDAGDWKGDAVDELESNRDEDEDDWLDDPWVAVESEAESMEEYMEYLEDHGADCLLSRIRDMTLEQLLCRVE